MSNVAVCGRERRQVSSRQQDIMFVEVSRLERDSAVRAVNELGQPQSKITHLVFCSPSRRVATTDYHLTRLLDVGPSVQHLSYQRGCFNGGTVLRCFKDLAETNRGVYVLVVCSEITPVRESREQRRHRRQGAIAAAEAEDLQIRLRLTSAELELVRKSEHEALVRAEKAEARLRENALRSRSRHRT